MNQLKTKLATFAVLFGLAISNAASAKCSGEIAKLLGCPKPVEVIDETLGKPICHLGKAVFIEACLKGGPKSKAACLIAWKTKCGK